MPHKLSSAAIEALRSTLQRVEQEWDLTPNDAALLELKRILLTRITELEAAQEAGPAVPACIPAVLESGPTSGDAATTLALDLAVSLVAQPPTGLPGLQETSEVQSTKASAGERGDA